MNPTVFCPHCRQHLPVQAVPPPGTAVQCYHCGAGFVIAQQPAPQPQQPPAQPYPQPNYPPQASGYPQQPGYYGQQTPSYVQPSYAGPAPAKPGATSPPNVALWAAIGGGS